MSKHESDPIIFSMAGIAFGIGMIFYGFNSLKKKRIIENLPSSTIRGAAVGPVEIKGKAVSSHYLASPFGRLTCSFYRYQIQEQRGSGKNKSWYTIASGDSNGIAPFLVQDQTGIIYVEPNGAEWETKLSYCYNHNGWWSFSELPLYLAQFMIDNHIEFDTNKKLKFFEWRFNVGQYVYILGTAQNTTRKLPRQLRGFEVSELMVSQHDNSYFIISDKSEKELINYLFLRSILIFLGAAMTIFCSVYLLHRLSLI